MLLAYQNLLDFYKTSNAAKKGTLTAYPSNDILCFKKVFNDESLLIFINVRNSSISFPIPTDFQNTTWTNTMTNSSENLGSSLNLNAYHYLILKN